MGVAQRKKKLRTLLHTGLETALHIFALGKRRTREEKVAQEKKFVVLAGDRKSRRGKINTKG